MKCPTHRVNVRQAQVSTGLELAPLRSDTAFDFLCFAPLASFHTPAGGPPPPSVACYSVLSFGSMIAASPFPPCLPPPPASFCLVSCVILLVVECHHVPPPPPCRYYSRSYTMEVSVGGDSLCTSSDHIQTTDASVHGVCAGYHKSLQAIRWAYGSVHARGNPGEGNGQPVPTRDSRNVPYGTPYTVHMQPRADHVRVLKMLRWFKKAPSFSLHLEKLVGEHFLRASLT